MRSTGRNGREESIISRLRFGHTGLNSSLFIKGKHGTGRCECGQVETIEHVMLNCQRYEEERRHLVGNLTKLRVPYHLTDISYNLTDILQKNLSVIQSYFTISDEFICLEKYCFFFCFYLFIFIHFLYILSSYSDPHSIPVGGGNAPSRCLPTANKTPKKRRSLCLCKQGWVVVHYFVPNFMGELAVSSKAMFLSARLQII